MQCGRTQAGLTVPRFMSPGCLTLSKNKEAGTGGLAGIGQFWGGVFGFFGALEVFFIGVGLLWFTAVYRDIHLKR
jgi:hypothetical protein